MAEEIHEEVDPDLQHQAQMGNVARILLDTLESWLHKQEQATISNVMQSIQHNGGKLDPDGAVHAWFEIRATRALKSHLEQMIRRGQAAAKRVPPIQPS